MTYAITVAVLVAALAGWLWWTATRVDRLHGRVETARAVLGSRLVSRAAAAQEVASAGLLDPASALVVADAAYGAKSAPPSARESAESDLTQTLAAAFPDPVEVARLSGDAQAKELLDDLAGACRDVELARRFHNDAVRSALRLRRRVRVRLFRLSGNAPLPESVEFDDRVPEGLRR